LIGEAPHLQNAPAVLCVPSQPSREQPQPIAQSISTEGQRPHPWRDATDHDSVAKHIVIVVIPLARS